MSIRYLFSDGKPYTIPAVGGADPGQALTIGADGALEWITPGAGPGGPIQDVLGTAGEIVAVKDDASGIVTISLPDNILTSAITLAYDSETANSGYTLPVTTEDIAGNPLVADSKYVMQYAAPVGDAAGVMQFALATAGTAGVTSIAGEDGITTSGPSGAVTLTLGAITPDSVTAGSVAVDSGANSYILPVPSALTDGAKYVVQYAAGGQLSFTEEAAGGGINNITSTASPASGSGIIVDSITDPAAPNLSLGDIKPTGVTVNEAYTFPTTIGTAGYVLGINNAGDQQLEWLANIGGIASLAEGPGIIITAATGPVATVELSPVVVAGTSLTVGTSTNAYSLPANNGGLVNAGKYVLQYTASGQQLAFTEETAGGAGVQTVTSKNDGTVGSGIVVDNVDAANPILELGNIVPESVSIKGQFTLPESITGAVAGYAMLLPTPLPSDGTSAQMIWGPVGGGTGGSGTVTNIVAGANIEVTGATPTVDPTISVNPIMTGVTSISAGEYTTAPTSATNKTLVNVNNALILKSGSATTLGTSLTFTDNDSASGFKCVNNIKGFQIITNEAGTVPPSTTPIQIGYILPTTQPTAVGQLLSVETLQTEVSGFTTTTWVDAGVSGIDSVESTNQNFITSNTSAGAVTLSLPSNLILTIPGTEASGEQQFNLGGLNITQTKVNEPTASDETEFRITNNSGLGLTVDSVGVKVNVTDTTYYVLPIDAPAVGQKFLQIGAPNAGVSECTWADGTASGINSINGTAGEIVATPEPAEPGTIKLTLDPNIIVPSNATGLASLTVGQCAISAQSSGDPLVTVTEFSIADPVLGNGLIVNNLGTKIQVGDGNDPALSTSTYFLPKNAPVAGDIITCVTAADGATPAVCSWAAAPAGDTVEATLTMTGVVIQSPPDETPKSTTITGGTPQFTINIYQAGVVKYIYMDFDILYSPGGCLCNFELSTDIVGELDCGNIDITDAQGLNSVILVDGADMNIGLISYSTTTKTGLAPNVVTNPTTTYGYATVVLKRIDTNTLTLRLVLTPKGTVTGTITDNTYGIAHGTYLTLGAVQSLSSFGNQTPSAKCMLSYY